MNRTQANTLVRTTFTAAFDKTRFQNFTLNLVNHLEESKAFARNSQYIKDAFKPHVQRFERIGTYTSPDKETLDVLVVHLTQDSKLERARTALRNFVADHLKERDDKDAALVAFVSPSETTWRFSYIKMEYATVEKESGKVGVERRLTPARRFSYIVGAGESCHTAQTRFLDLLQDTENNPTLADIEAAFSVETVTKEFFTQYAGLFALIHAALDKLITKDKSLRDEFAAKNVNTVDFAKKLMGQIVFLYFLQKKGWLGVAKGEAWGTGPRDFMKRLADGKYANYENFFNDVLEPLFYDELAADRGHEAWSKRFQCRIPFLNGGLFEAMGDYNWQKTDILLPNKLFINNEFVEEGIKGTGVLDVFDRYNFTVNESEPLEKEVAIDPEMLGKVFENLIEENRRKGLGAYYTPREIVHYMCQESLINYLDTAINTRQEAIAPQKPTQDNLFGEAEPEQTALQTTVRDELVPRADIETFVHLGEQISHYEAVETEYRIKMPKSIEKNARLLDDALADITVCDPAVGSGAFPVGMMSEIVRARSALTPYFNDIDERTPYYFKRHAIQNSLYGVDIDAGAVEIAKLRLWLSLVVDEDDVRRIKPLPNLDYKVVAGNSLLEVVKSLFNIELFNKLERLKPLYFDESDRTKKALYKRDIDNLIDRLTNSRQKFDFKIYFSEIFHQRGRFDVMLGNPPYIKEYTNRAAFDGVRQSPYYQGKMDIWYLFACLSLDLLKPSSGVLAFIATNNWVTNSGASKFRNKIVGDATILTLIDFGDFKIFESAGIQTMVLICARSNQLDQYNFDLRKLTDSAASLDDVVKLLQKSPSLVAVYLEPQFARSNFKGKPLVFSETKAEIVLNKISGMSNFVLNANDEVAQGIVPNPDVVTGRAIGKISPAKISKYNILVGDGVFVIPRDYLLDLPSDERQYLKPLFEPSELQRYYLPQNHTKEIIYLTKKNWKPSLKGLKAHLERYREIMDARRENQTGQLNFYHLHWPRNEHFFQSGPKILCVRKCEQPTFVYTEADAYVMMAFNVIRSQRINLKYLTAILNSKLVAFWLRHKGKMQGYMYQVDKEPLLAIPLISMPLDGQKPLIKLVDRILVAKKEDPEANTTRWENEIDQLVYELYGLTKEEKTVVENHRPS